MKKFIALLVSLIVAQLFCGEKAKTGKSGPLTGGWVCRYHQRRETVMEKNGGTRRWKVSI